MNQRFPFVSLGVHSRCLLACLAYFVVSSALAQIYSSNVVGYVHLSLGAHGASNLIANPLNGTDNLPNTILPLADEWMGTAIILWDATTQAYREAIFFNGSGRGWARNDSSWSLNPGKGFWILPHSDSGTSSNLAGTFVGEVPEGILTNAIPGGRRISYLSSMVPRALPLGQSGQGGTLQFPAQDGDMVRLWNPAMQVWIGPYIYFDVYGWFPENADDPDPGPAGPVIEIGQAFEVQSFGSDRLVR